MRSFNAGPDFIIAGTQKGGTTSLYRYLAAHPSVVTFPDKELHCFDTERFHQGLSWYVERFERKAKRGAGAVAGEASPYYLVYPHAAARIASSFPLVRVIILLRDPVDRAYSHYQHEVRHGTEPLSFEEAVARESERIGGEFERMLGDPRYYSSAFRHYSYLARGVYAEQLPRWLACFPPAQLLILESERLFADPASTFAQVVDFLGLPPWRPSHFPVFHAGNYRQKVAPQTRERLAEHFRRHNRRLCDQLGRKFSWADGEFQDAVR